MTQAPRRILITGAGGFLGRHLADTLKKGFLVRTLDIIPASEPGCDFIEGSVADAGTVRRALEGMDAVVIAHMAPNQPGVYDEPSIPLDVNVKGTVLLLQGAVERNIKRVILISSIGVVERQRQAGAYLHVGLLPAPDNLYGLTKLLQEEAARYYHHKHGLEIAILRPAYVILEDSLEDKYGRKPPTVNWQFIDPRDIGDAVAAALRLPGLGCETFFLVGGPDAETHSDIGRTKERLGWAPRHDFSCYPRDASN